jgi:polar amino acid transport system substrate-binding protein
MANTGQDDRLNRAMAAVAAVMARLRSLGRCLCWLPMLLAPGFAPAANLKPAAPLGANADESSFVGRWTRMIHREAFRRMQVPMEFTQAPLRRITMMAEQGAIDGELSRAPVYGEAHPEMLLVDVMMMEAAFSIYTAKPMPGVKRIEDLRDRGNLQGAYTRGVLGCENVLQPLFASNRLTAVPTAKNGLGMLAIGHADFFCDSSTGMLNALRSDAGRKGLQPYKLFDLGPKVALSPYLHKRHAALVPVLTATLKQMKAEGLFERYWLEAEKLTNPP